MVFLGILLTFFGGSTFLYFGFCAIFCKTLVLFNTLPRPANITIAIIGLIIGLVGATIEALNK